MTTSIYYSSAVAVAVGTVLLLVFGIGALGIIGDGGRPDMLYGAALAVGLAGALITRFRADGMAVSMAATAIVTVLVGIGAVVAGLHEDGSAFDVLMISSMYAALFTTSAWLFRRAGETSADRRTSSA
ncbi:MAG: hypothetical protein JWN68_2694 [Nocardioides sp.]|jgi:hypothetical protein|uniref:hypothetical protein n=1 Tax=Nocardioides sp. TaxID=35761 RepID=UPI00263985B9|nr:hypothetical protein [Nocardioides sp.]MCW2834741.1 hypothetical protein [Nocardioides sp.]